jgi:hypothetical protein
VVRSVQPARILTTENGGCTGPPSVIHREQKELTSAMNNFINALKQPVPAAN